MHRRLLFPALFGIALGGCGHVSAPAVTQPIVATAQPISRVVLIKATGIWEWMFRSTDEQGDMRVEQEEWHLEQKGRDVRGYYDRAVTMMSTDERLFRCNQQLAFTKFTRVRIAGYVEGGRLVLQEVGFDAKPSPCDDGARNLVKYVGVVNDGTMRLQWAPGGGQVLHRREGVEGPTLAQTAGAGESFTAAAIETGSRATVAVEGVWEWELKSIDAEGDERDEREEWHLEETADGIGGYYVRKVTRQRGDGTFTCNAEPTFETITRYNIKGLRQGDRIALTETDYNASPSRCDNGLRRLDTYHGTVSGDGDELVLSWGPGNQLLRRHR